MTKFRNMLATLAATMLAAGPAAAQTTGALPLVPLPSIFDFTGGSGWGVALGLGAEYETAYDGSDEYETALRKAYPECVH